MLDETFSIVDGLCLRTGLVVRVADADSCRALDARVVGRVGGRDVAPLSGWGLRVGRGLFLGSIDMDRTIYIGGLCDVVRWREDVYRAQGRWS